MSSASHSGLVHLSAKTFLGQKILDEHGSEWVKADSYLDEDGQPYYPELLFIRSILSDQHWCLEVNGDPDFEVEDVEVPSDT